MQKLLSYVSYVLKDFYYCHEEVFVHSMLFYGLAFQSLSSLNC